MKFSSEMSCSSSAPLLLRSRVASRKLFSVVCAPASASAPAEVQEQGHGHGQEQGPEQSLLGRPSAKSDSWALGVTVLVVLGLKTLRGGRRPAARAGSPEVGARFH